MIDGSAPYLVVAPCGTHGWLVFPKLEKQEEVGSKEHAFWVLSDVRCNRPEMISDEEVAHLTREITISTLLETSEEFVSALAQDLVDLPPPTRSPVKLVLMRDGDIYWGTHISVN